MSVGSEVVAVVGSWWRMMGLLGSDNCYRVEGLEVGSGK